MENENLKIVEKKIKRIEDICVEIVKLIWLMDDELERKKKVE